MLIACAALGSAAEDSAVIVNSGSTNRPGFRIVVLRTGAAEYTETGRRPDREPAKPQRRSLPPALVKRFYADLDSAKPLPALPPQRCAKSASFGSRLTVQLGDEETPDLSCPSPRDGRVKALARDVNGIVKTFRPR